MTYNLSDAQLADAVYKFNVPLGWELSEKFESPEFGCQGALYRNVQTNEYVFANRGTEPGVPDAGADYLMGMGKVPAQFRVAVDFFREAQGIVSHAGGDSSAIRIVGHSLGGSIPQALGVLTGNPTVTFNAYGVGRADGFEGESTVQPNITNHVMYGDPISVMPGSRTLGDTYAYGHLGDADAARYSPRMWSQHSISNFIMIPELALAGALVVIQKTPVNR